MTLFSLLAIAFFLVLVTTFFLGSSLVWLAAGLGLVGLLLGSSLLAWLADGLGLVVFPRGMTPNPTNQMVGKALVPDSNLIGVIMVIQRKELSLCSEDTAYRVTAIYNSYMH